jgi:hypothetical protein
MWWFDMFGGWFDNPEMLNVIKRHRELSQKQALKPMKAEIALVVDENGLKHFKRNAPSLFSALSMQNAELALSGAPYHIYLADDIANEAFPFDDYKLYVFANICHPSEKVKNAINSKLKSGGRTLFWTYFAGIENAELTDFNITYSPALPDVRCQYSKREFKTYNCAYEPDGNNGFASFPAADVPCPRFAGYETENAYTLANIKDSAEPAILWKQFENYASVYSIVPEVPREILRELIYMSGAHVYSTTGDAFMASGNIAAIHATSDGEKRIHFPFPVSI